MFSAVLDAPHQLQHADTTPPISRPCHAMLAPGSSIPHNTQQLVLHALLRPSWVTEMRFTSAMSVLAIPGNLQEFLQAMIHFTPARTPSDWTVYGMGPSSAGPPTQTLAWTVE